MGRASTITEADTSPSATTKTTATSACAHCLFERVTPCVKSRFWLAGEASGLTKRAMANCDPLTTTCGRYAGMWRRLASEHPLPRRWSSLTAATERTRVRHAFSCRLSLLFTF